MSTTISTLTVRQAVEKLVPRPDNYATNPHAKRTFDGTLNGMVNMIQQVKGHLASQWYVGIIAKDERNNTLGLWLVSFDEMNKNREAINANARVLDEHKVHTTKSLAQHTQQITDLTSALDSKEAALAGRIEALDLSLTQAQQQLLDNINTMRQSIIDTVRSDLQTRIIDATLQDNRLNDRIDQVNRGLKQRIKDAEGGLNEAESRLAEKDQQIQNLTSRLEQLERLVQSIISQGASS